MKAVVYERYGPPEVLQLRDIKKPEPGDDDVLVKVYVTTVTATDCTFRKGEPYFARLFTGITKPKHTIPGNEFTGEVVWKGRNVKGFTEGDQVFGTTPGYGAYAEYIVLPENESTLALKPSNFNFFEAASCLDGFLTALPFLRDKGNLKAGKKVLINGASGSVGSAAVQLAKIFDAEVTGVCSTLNTGLIKSIGADKVIDYKKTDFTTTGETYDIIFDTAGNLSFKNIRQSLNTNGIFLQASIGPGVFPYVLLTSITGTRKAKIAATGLRSPKERTKDLLYIKDLAESGRIKPVIDKEYKSDQISEAHRYVDTGHKRGNVVIDFT